MDCFVADAPRNDKERGRNGEMRAKQEMVKGIGRYF